MLSILDSGMGGRCFYEAMPFQAHLVIDSSAFPYGNKDIEWLKDHFIALINQIDSHTIIVACNTLSSLIFYYQLDFHKRVVDVITPTIFYLRKQNFRTIGIMATTNTIKMNIYGRLLNQPICYYDASEIINQIEYQKVSDLDNELKDFFKDCDCIVLGCTHLIRIKDSLREVFNIPIVSQDEIMLNWFKE